MVQRSAANEHASTVEQLRNRWSGKMGYAADKKNLYGYVADKLPVWHSARDKTAGILRHIFDAVAEWSHGDEDRDAGDFIARSGGRLTDNIEREMMERKMVSNWTVHD
jgi:hypothetical protein